MRGVKKYNVLKSFSVNQTLFLPDDIVYIEYYDPVSGRRQNVFNSDRQNIALITSSTYWDLRKGYIEEIKTNTEIN